jgi:class 3 adenylate cyclase
LERTGFAGRSTGPFTAQAVGRGVTACTVVDLERQFLVSGDAMERLADLGGFALDDLGPQRLRGRAAAMHVYAVAAKPSTNGQKTTARTA